MRGRDEGRLEEGQIRTMWAQSNIRYNKRGGRNNECHTCGRPTLIIMQGFDSLVQPQGHLPHILNLTGLYFPAFNQQAVASSVCREGKTVTRFGKTVAVH